MPRPADIKTHREIRNALCRKHDGLSDERNNLNIVSFSARSCEGSRPVLRYAGRSILCNCGRSSDHGSAGDVAAQEGDGT